MPTETIFEAWQTVVLTKTEYRIAQLIGLERERSSRGDDLEHDNFTGELSQEEWKGIDVMGAAAELAYCKARGTYFEPRVNNFKGPDVGKNIQIRSTEHLNGQLVIRPKDNPSHFFVLVIQLSKYSYRVVGFMKAEQAMAEKAYKSNPRNGGECWMVPQSHLLSLPEPESRHG